MERDDAVARKRSTIVLLTIGSLWISKHNFNNYWQVTKVTNTHVFCNVYNVYHRKHGDCETFPIPFFLSNRRPFIKDEV